MVPSPKPSIAVLGAGPIGLEAALYARALGHPVTVYEAGTVGSHLRAWGHVRLFTPWSLDVSPLGSRRLGETNSPLPVGDDHPTGTEMVERYLLPLSRLPELSGAVREQTRVVAVGRGFLLKGDGIGDGSRGKERFRILLETREGEHVEEADVILDATGVYGQPNPLGRGGIPAPGERALAPTLVTGIPDVEGEDRARFAGKRVVVVGGGYSAATTVVALAGLRNPKTTWVTRNAAPPIHEVPDDPLPARADLARRANRLAGDPPPGFRHLAEGTVASLAKEDGGIVVTVAAPGGEERVTADVIVAQTGFRPDNSLHRELQIHECYASQAPMKLAAAILGGGSGDCMTQSGFGPDSLTSPEPGYFLLGHKSYGRNPQFLLRIGREQVRDVFRLVSGDPRLDLYAEEGARV